MMRDRGRQEFQQFACDSSWSQKGEEPHCLQVPVQRRGDVRRTYWREGLFDDAYASLRSLPPIEFTSKVSQQ